jgi:hypothetical protein
VSLFGKVVRTVVNTATLPVAVVKDVFTLGGVSRPYGEGSYIVEQLQKIKDEADD